MRDATLEQAVSTFIRQQLDIPIIELSSKDNETIRTDGLKQYLFRAITSSKFRRTSLDSQTISDTYQKIERHLAEGTPIGFSVPFGAYKGWQLDSYPEPDWAEVFNVRYLCRFATKVAAAYPPGVVLSYSYTDEVMHIVSNTPPSDNKRYMAVFRDILSVFQHACPPNVTIQAVRINDLYAEGELISELERNYEFNVAHWDEKYSKEERDYKLRSARRNLNPNGIEDLGGLTESEWEDRFIRAAMWCDALDCLERRRWFNKHSSNIQIIFVRGRYMSLHFGSCETSTTQFWVGTGVAEMRQSQLFPRIISPASWLSIADQTAVIPLAGGNPFATLSANYGKIPVLQSCERVL